MGCARRRLGRGAEQRPPRLCARSRRRSQWGEPMPSEPLPFAEILRSRVWFRLALGQVYEFQSTIFQPVGGMDLIARAFAREVGSLIRYNAKVTAIKQNEHHVTVSYLDATTGGAPMTATADWCLCTIPLSVLNQIDLDVGASMMNAINAVPYGAAGKIGMQFKRRFWEEDEQIYGGITYTDLPIWQIGYPSTSYDSSGRACCSAPTCSTVRMLTSSLHCHRRTA